MHCHVVLSLLWIRTCQVVSMTGRLLLLDHVHATLCQCCCVRCFRHLLQARVWLRLGTIGDFCLEAPGVTSLTYLIAYCLCICVCLWLCIDVSVTVCHVSLCVCSLFHSVCCGYHTLLFTICDRKTHWIVLRNHRHSLTCQQTFLSYAPW